MRNLKTIENRVLAVLKEHPEVRRARHKMQRVYSDYAKN